MADGKLAFGPFMLDAARGALLRNGAPVALGQRALAVLAALAETPGRTVAKDDLLARAWPGTLVEEGNLTVQIAALRKALGPGPDGRDWIVTVPRVGYRLARVDGSAAADAGAEPPGLAVLPFQVLGGAIGDTYFADGVTEDITTALGETPGLTVAKEELLARAWPGTLVEEGNLTVQIAGLRKALGPEPDGRDWIVTVRDCALHLRHGGDGHDRKLDYPHPAGSPFQR